jgi:hypothetical protein
VTEKFYLCLTKLSRRALRNGERMRAMTAIRPIVTQVKLSPKRKLTMAESIEKLIVKVIR